MFYSQFILAKKGPLGTIWIAAHLERKLRKNQVADTDIGVSVDSILFPDVPIALRLSSHLLLGVVRIYSRKVNYLFHDCSEALVKVKQAFRSTAVDLPPEESTAPYHSITLPETFDLDDFELPDSETFQGNYVDHHISSKEQITLQDTMDGVVYSTSQFGLDERFGDGDTSQIRLDLDEELFLDKVATPGHTVVLLERNSAHPRESGQPMTPFSTMDMDEDENNLGEERMAGASEDMPATAKLKHFDSNSQDQYTSPLCSGDIDDSNLNNKGFLSERPTPYPSKDLSDLPPSTPRLEEETVLTNGHVEDPKLNLVNETPASSSVDVVMQDATCNLQMESENCKQIELAGEENLENHRSRQDIHAIEEASVPAVVATDSISSEVRHSISSPTSVLAEQSKAISPPSECLDSTLAVPSIKGSTLTLQGGIASDKKTGFSEADQDHGNGVEGVSDVVVEPINSEGVARQRISFDTAAAETLVEGSATESTKNYHSVSEDISNGKLASHKASSEQQAFTEVGLVHDPCTPSPADSLLRSVDAYGKVELKDGSEPENLKAQNHVLLDGRQCTLEDGEECHPIGVKDAGLEANKILVPCEGANVGSPSNMDGNLDNVISKDIQEENGSVSCDVAVPAPEILLSATLGIGDPPSDLRGMSIPEREVSAEHEVSDEGSKILSGRKRRFAENTPILQDVNAAKLSVAPRSKRFKDSIPDDDDLLSSILAGRRSSALKLKPTPLPLEVAYGKRPRGASRVSVPKRKVLMDDTLVLHGDTIRQQLTSTEDIRRLRKKAPCTRPEIWMIQKHLLEDEVFVEPLFTGMSEDLIGLHDRTYYLTEFRVSRDNVKQELSRVPDNVKISGITSPIGETNLEERAAPAPIGNDSGVHTTSANHHNSIDCNAQQQKEAPSDVLALDLPVDGPVAEGTAMEIEKLDNEVTDIADHVGNCGIVSTSPAVHVPRDKCDIASDTVTPSLPLDVSNGAQTPLQNEGNMDIQFDEKDGDKTNCKADDAMIVTQVIEEGSTLGFSTVMDESFTQSITESGLVDQVPQNYMQEPRDSICGSASRQDVSVTKDDSLKQKASESGIIDAVPQKREGDMCGSVDGCGSSLAEGVSTAKDEAAIMKITESVQFDMSGRPLSPITVPMDNRLLENGADVCVERDASVVVEDCEALRSELGMAAGDVSLGKLKDAKSNAKLIETQGNSSFPLDFNQDVSQGDNLSSKERILDAEAATPVNAAMNEVGDFGNTLDENHTEFLNFDDEEAIEEADTSMPSADEARILDNSGWSSRTRAVAKYLQTLFDDEPEHARKALPMDNLLSGKTRKEASRMFFETLVLKTRDYVKVQQDNPFATICIKPTGKLLKSDF